MGEDGAVDPGEEGEGGEAANEGTEIEARGANAAVEVVAAGPPEVGEDRDATKSPPTTTTPTTTETSPEGAVAEGVAEAEEVGEDETATIDSSSER